MSAFATSSRTATSGNARTVLRSAWSDNFICWQLRVNITDQFIKASGIAFCVFVFSQGLNASRTDVLNNPNSLALQPREVAKIFCKENRPKVCDIKAARLTGPRSIGLVEARQGWRRDHLGSGTLSRSKYLG